MPQTSHRARWRHLVLAALVAVLVAAGVPALSAPGDSYVRPHFGDGQLPAGCITDRDPANPDNECWHMLVGLNALDTPQVDVVVLVPASPAAERDLRVMEQVIDMWEGGIKLLSGQMGMEWLRDGVDFRVTGRIVPANPSLEEVEPLVDPEIVVVASNPAGGIGIGIDPSDFVSQIGITDGEGVPCADFATGDLFSLDSWEQVPGYDGHHGDQGGIYVEDCGGVGGNVCFAVNGAIDPVPGTTDFFGLFDLVAHEVGHCLTVGHVGDGADGPWGPTPFNDIMAYSTDPPGISKCVSTLDVEGFAIQMSKYLDRDGDGAVTERDHLVPNDPGGEGENGFQVQHPDDHHYASATGDPRDCPQPDVSPVPGAPATDWMPKPVATTRPVLSVGGATVRDGRVVVSGRASRVALEAPARASSGTQGDNVGDASTPAADIQQVSVEVTRRVVQVDLEVPVVNPLTNGGGATAYAALIDGRRFDSFIANGTTDGAPTTVDNGAGTVLPKGTSTWDADARLVRFRIPRAYLADQRITAPYSVNGLTGFHARTNDWLGTDDVAPDDGVTVDVRGPRMQRVDLDAPLATRRTVTTRSLEAEGGNTFAPTDSTLGVGLLPTGARDRLDLPVARQSRVQVTLRWDDPASFLGLKVSGGSTQTVRENEDGSITVTVPWARRDLVVEVDPEQISGPVTYTVEARLTTLTAADDADGDRVPDGADDCVRDPGPAVGGGCPDRDGDLTPDRFDRCPTVPGTGATGCPAPGDERVVVLVDGQRVASQAVLTDHRAAPFRLSTQVRGAREVTVLWYDGARVVDRVTRRLG